MSFVGVTYAFSQGVLAKPLVQFWGEGKGRVVGMMSCCLVLGAGRYVAYYTDSVVTMHVSFFFIINALGVMNTVLTADSGAIAPREELGSLFGLLQASESAAGMVSATTRGRPFPSSISFPPYACFFPRSGRSWAGSFPMPTARTLR